MGANFIGRLLLSCQCFYCSEKNVPCFFKQWGRWHCMVQKHTSKDFLANMVQEQHVYCKATMHDMQQDSKLVTYTYQSVKTCILSLCCSFNWFQPCNTLPLSCPQNEICHGFTMAEVTITKCYELCQPSQGTQRCWINLKLHQAGFLCKSTNTAYIFDPHK